VSPASLRVRLLQTDPLLGEVSANLHDLEQSVKAAGTGVDLVVTPELATHGYHLGALAAPEPLVTSDPRLLALGEHGSLVVAGLVEAHNSGVYNSAALIDADGIAVQRKLTLPTYRQWEERKHFRPGSGIAVHSKVGARIAVLICNDMWHAALPYLAAHAGAEIIVVPVNSAESDVGSPTARVWDAILMNTALTLQTYVVYVNRVGVECGARFSGGSTVISPQGEVLGRLGDEAGHLDVELDLAHLRTLRRQWPLLQEPGLDLVAREAARLRGLDD